MAPFSAAWDAGRWEDLVDRQLNSLWLVPSGAQPWWVCATSTSHGAGAATSRAMLRAEQLAGCWRARLRVRGRFVGRPMNLTLGRQRFIVQAGALSAGR